jgi:polyribonucleotide nucleotidyltransferase
MSETQVIITVFSADQEFDPDILAMNGASTALAISDIPWNGPIAAARVGYINGEYVLNPTTSQLEKSAMNLVVAGTESAVVMVEGSTGELSEDVVLEAIFFAHEGIQPLIELQNSLRGELGKEKREVVPPEVNETLKAKVEEVAAGGMEEVVTTADKMERGDRYDKLKVEVLEQLDEETYESEGEVFDLLSAYKKAVMRGRIVNEGQRLDGRSFDEVRPIDCEVGVLPRTHGSALFTRGETQAMVVGTLGSERDEQHLEGLEGSEFRRFMLHYNFPPFCVGEVRFLRGPSRRDIGHGTLARRGIEAVLPSAEDFPYTMRIVSEVLESNGSSSMATVCGASLALMDAGVPIKAPVSGVAMGLIKEGDKVVVLTDILGDEDHLGDMDFKVVGTSKGIAALQMDIKIEGVDREVMADALSRAKDARLHILVKMEEALGIPREDVSDHAPKYVTIKIHPDKIRDIIGPGGKVIREMTAEFDSKIDVEDHGTVKIKDFGAFVQILPGTDGMVHISELANYRVNKVTDILKEGDRVKVKVIDVDGRGRIRLSRKAALEEGEE